MRPVLFEIGSFSVYSYGAMLFLAFAVGSYWALKEAPVEGIDRDHLYESIIISIVLSMLGSRLAFVLLHLELFRGEPWWRIFAFRDGGLVFYGGLFAALLGVFFYCRFRRISFLKLLDHASPFIILGYAITRVGCFLNGCCYGAVTQLPWAVVYPFADGAGRHPTQLYAVAAGLLIFVLLRKLKRFKTFEGYTFLLFLIFYGIYRFLIEFVRVHESVLGFMTPYQLASLVLVVLAASVFFWRRSRVAALS